MSFIEPVPDIHWKKQAVSSSLSLLTCKTLIDPWPCKALALLIILKPYVQYCLCDKSADLLLICDMCLSVQVQSGTMLPWQGSWLRQEC